jgi:hypothetical protein
LAQVVGQVSRRVVAKTVAAVVGIAVVNTKAALVFRLNLGANSLGFFANLCSGILES